jgi:hypothetical protein
MMDREPTTGRIFDEEFFQEVLDASPTDSAARWLLAEWLGGRGDESAAGYFWLGSEAIMPQYYPSTQTWDWNDETHFSELTGAIPHSLFDQLRDGRRSASAGFREYLNRHLAEKALCRVFAGEIDIDLSETRGYGPTPRPRPRKRP